MQVIDYVHPQVSKIKCPCLIIHSESDQVAKPNSATWMYDQVSSQNKTLLWTFGDHYMLLDTKDHPIEMDAINSFCIDSEASFQSQNS